MIIVTARLVFASQAARDAAVEASIPIQSATREGEPGCLMYCFAPDPAVPTEIQVYELWEDAASLEKHFAHENYFAMARALQRVDGFQDSVNRLWVADDRGTVYDESGKPRIAALE